MMSGAQAPSPVVVAARQRAHQVRAARERIVTLAQEYRKVCRANDGLLAVLMQGDENSAALREAEHRSWEQVEMRREALFGALEELEMVEGGGAPVTWYYQRLVEHARAAGQSGATPRAQAELLIADALRWVESHQAWGAYERAALAGDLVRALGFGEEEGEGR